MNKAELVAAMSAKTGESKKVTEETLNAFVEAARKGRNPQTKEEIKIPASKAPVFKAGKALKETVNK